MNYNPLILSTDQLQLATDVQILKAQYEYIVASTSLAFAMVFFYFFFKALLWFLPRYYYRSNEGRQ